MMTVDLLYLYCSHLACLCLQLGKFKNSWTSHRSNDHDSIIRVSLTVVPNIFVLNIARWGVREFCIAIVAVNTAALRPSESPFYYLVWPVSCVSRC